MPWREVNKEVRKPVASPATFLEGEGGCLWHRAQHGTHGRSASRGGRVER